MSEWSLTEADRIGDEIPPAKEDDMSTEDDLRAELDSMKRGMAEGNRLFNRYKDEKEAEVKRLKDDNEELQAKVKAAERRALTAADDYEAQLRHLRQQLAEAKEGLPDG